MMEQIYSYLTAFKSIRTNIGPHYNEASDAYLIKHLYIKLLIYYQFQVISTDKQ